MDTTKVKASCKELKESNCDKTGSKGTSKMLPPIPSQAEKKPDKRLKTLKINKGHSKLM